MFTSVLQKFTLFIVLLFCLIVGEHDASGSALVCANNVICNATSCELDQVLNDVENGSRVSLFPGNYKLKRNVTLSYRRNISIDGLYEAEKVRIFCDPGVGFSFLRSEGIYILYILYFVLYRNNQIYKKGQSQRLKWLGQHNNNRGLLKEQTGLINLQN